MGDSRVQEESLGMIKIIRLKLRLGLGPGFLMFRLLATLRLFFGKLFFYPLPFCLETHQLFKYFRKLLLDLSDPAILLHLKMIFFGIDSIVISTL